MRALDATSLAIVVGASLLGSFVKAVTGMGYPLIAVPLLTLALGIEAAIAIVALPNLVANATLNYGVRAHRRDTRDLPMLVGAGVVGAVAGTFLLVELPEQPLLAALALTIFAFVIQRARNPELRLAAATTRRWSPLAGTLAGLSQGALGVSGPIVAMWLHGYRLEKDAYVFAITLLFLTTGAAQLAVLLAADVYDRERLLASALALVATVAVIPLGTRLRARLDNATFERLILALLLVSGASLVARAWGS